MRVRVTAVNADGSTNARSEQTAVVESNAAPLNNTARPTITGEARVGQELTANEGTWTGNPTSFAFQWQRCDVDSLTCANVIGATGRNVRRPHRRPRLPSARGGDCTHGQSLRNGNLERDGSRRPDDADHQPKADHPLHLGPLHRSTRLCAVPDLRRHAAEPGDPRDRDSTGCRFGQPALRDPRCHRSRVPPTRATGSRRSASVGPVATRSPFVRGTRPG